MKGQAAMRGDHIPEQVHLDAARARVLTDIGGTVGSWDPERVEQMIQTEAERPENRAAVESAYRAGQAAALPEGAQVVRVVITPTEWQQATEAIYGPFPPGNPPFEPHPAVDALSRRAVREGALHVQAMPLSPPPAWVTDATPADGQGRDG